MSLCRLLVRQYKPCLTSASACLAGKTGENYLTSQRNNFSKEAIVRSFAKWERHERFEQQYDSRSRRYLAATALGLFSFAFWRTGSSEDDTPIKTIPVDKQIWKNLKVTLYQYQTCPFCTKARTFLQYYQVPFEIVEVHPIFKKEIKFSKGKKVPVVTIETENGIQEMRDSSLIISIISTYMVNNGAKSFSDIMGDYPSSTIVGEDGKEKEIVLNKYWILTEEPDKPAIIDGEDPRQVEAEWRRWTDDHLVHLISPNVYRTLRESYQAFAHHVELGKFKGTWEGVVAKVFGCIAMWAISKKLKKKYHMNDDVRLDLYRACNDWCKALGKKKFMGGEEPNLADLSVYAVLNVMEGLVSFDDVTKYTKIKPWYLRVKAAVEEKRTAFIEEDSSC